MIVDHVTAAGPVRALDCPSLHVAAGTSLAVMGTSGCGKSTLLGLLAGLAVPTTGTVQVGDVVVSALGEPDRVAFRRRTIGMVYQADNLLPHLTVEENVGLQLAIAGVAAGSDAVARVGAVLDRLGLASLAHRLPDQLSGGQRQRVAVARAVITRPAVVLADEPTGSLDDASAAAVRDLLQAVTLQLQATLVVVTHDPAVAALADRTVQLASPVLAGELWHG